MEKGVSPNFRGQKFFGKFFNPRKAIDGHSPLWTLAPADKRPWDIRPRGQTPS